MKASTAEISLESLYIVKTCNSDVIFRRRLLQSFDCNDLSSPHPRLDYNYAFFLMKIVSECRLRVFYINELITVRPRSHLTKVVSLRGKLL